MPEPKGAFLRACRGLPTSHTPVWFMRQAGRYLPQFQELLAAHSLTELMETPDLASRATLQPIDVLGVDAAILFSDILPPLKSLGLRVNLAGSDGPAIENPLRSNYEIDLLPTPPAEEHLSAILETVRLCAEELAGRDIPVIGFGGAPFTLATYAIEGGPTRDFSRTKALMYSEPAAWRRLMSKLVTIQVDLLAKQVKQGASALQVFDSWSGLALSREDYRRYVLPYHRSLFDALGRTGVPVIHFSTGTAAYIADVAAAGGDVLSVDWRMPLDWFWSQIDGQAPVQGNLDPAALLAPWRELQYRSDAVLAQAGGRPGHIFNLGHGVLPMTSADTVKRVVDYVHERTERGSDRRGEWA
ncbi:MAG: uroporphyrinogen decarboxylase [Caldilineaceae bacterium]